MIRNFILMLGACLCCFASTDSLLAGTNRTDNSPLENEQPIEQINSQLKTSQKEFELFLSKKTICVDTLPKCLPVNEITTDRPYAFSNQKQKQTNLLLFPKVINLKKLVELSHILNLSNKEQKQLVQRSSIQLNDFSNQWLLKQYQYLLKKSKLTFEKLPINNSILIAPKIEQSSVGVNLSTSNIKPTFQTASPFVVGILDSGVSVFHQQMQDVNVYQYNPLEDSFELKDTGLGHASGLLSLLSVNQNKEIEQGYLQDGNFLSCNGLPKGKYNYRLILQCMNWFFIQPKVDVIINAWLASEPGCKNEWQQPIEALLAANIIPVFSAGNYANNNKGMNYSPANLILDNVSYPLITVGALSEKLERLPDSSYGLSTCNNPHSFAHYQANIFSKGENLKMAIPFSKTSYQLASGTSYSLVKVSAIIAKIKHRFPEKKNVEIVNALLHSATQLKIDNIDGYGQVNYKGALQYLNLPLEKQVQIR